MIKICYQIWHSNLLNLDFYKKSVQLRIYVDHLDQISLCIWITLQVSFDHLDIAISKSCKSPLVNIIRSLPQHQQVKIWESSGHKSLHRASNRSGHLIWKMTDPSSFTTWTPVNFVRCVSVIYLIGASVGDNYLICGIVGTIDDVVILVGWLSSMHWRASNIHSKSNTHFSCSW